MSRVAFSGIARLARSSPVSLLRSRHPSNPTTNKLLPSVTSLRQLNQLSGTLTTRRTFRRRLKMTVMGEAVFSGSSAGDLKAWLEAGGISTAGWGQGASKSVDFLFAEVEEGESQLTLDTNGKPVRTVSVLNVTLRNSRGQTLIEAAQVLPSGSRRERGVVLSEKMLPNEDWERGAMRAIQEELGPVLPAEPQITVDRTSYKTVVETKMSQSYPGLLSEYICHRVDAAVPGLPEEDFVTDEDRADGLLQHVWEWR